MQIVDGIKNGGLELDERALPAALHELRHVILLGYSLVDNLGREPRIERTRHP